MILKALIKQHRVHVLAPLPLVGPSSHISGAVCSMLGRPERRNRFLPAWVGMFPKNWVAVKELSLSYYLGETILFTMYTHYGNFI